MARTKVAVRKSGPKPKKGEKVALYKKLLAMKLDSAKIRRQFGNTLSKLTLAQLKTLHGNVAAYKKSAKKPAAKKVAAKKSSGKKSSGKKSNWSIRAPKKSPVKKAGKTASQKKLARSACPNKLSRTAGGVQSKLTLKAATKGAKECLYKREGHRVKKSPPKKGAKSAGKRSAGKKSSGKKARSY